MNLQVVLHETDILLESLRKFILCAASGEILVPSLELRVYRGDFGLRIERELVGLLAVNYIRCSDLDSPESIEAV